MQPIAYKQIMRAKTQKPLHSGDVTVKDRPDARKRYRRLKPWLELANIAAAEFFSSINSAVERMDREMQTAALEPLLTYVHKAENTKDFPADQMREWFARPRDESVSEELAPMERVEPLYNLARNVAQTFLFYLDEIPWDFADEDGPRLIARLSKTKDGRAEVEVFDPYRDYFVPAIQGVELERIRRCPVCKKIFFRLRYKAGSEYGSKACSPQCTQNQRVRRWREKQENYSYNRKCALAGVRPGGKER